MRRQTSLLFEPEPPLDGVIAGSRPAEVARAAGAGSIVHRHHHHLVADVRDAGPEVPVFVAVRVAEVARRPAAVEAACASVEGGIVVVILHAAGVANRPAGAAGRPAGLQLDFPDVRRDVVLGVQDARRDVRAGRHRDVRADSPAALVCPFPALPACPFRVALFQAALVWG